MQVPEGTSGLVVQDVDPASDASAKGLQAGDLIVEAGQQPVASLADLERSDHRGARGGAGSRCWC